MLNKVLIVGQGLAGSAIARYLQQNGIGVHIVASPEKASASRIAAGVWNPVVVKRFVPAWYASEALTVSRDFYAQEEDRLGKRFFHTHPLHKLLSNEAEIEQMRQQWDKRHLGEFCDADLVTELPAGVHDFPSALRIRESGYLDVPLYLDSLAENWEKEGVLSKAEFDYDQLKQVDGKWTYRQDHFDKVIFCEGIGALANPFLSDMPLVKMKGEILRVKLPALKSDITLNKSIFILPQANAEFKVGATYNRDAADTLPTEEGKAELIEKLSEIVDTEGLELVDHSAGYRPAVKDRRPLVGEVPNYRGLYVLNGLGSRGVMLAPLMAQWLGEHLLNGKTLPEEVLLRRFLK
ncbi:MAG: FAD-binding oxidoreductase [Bacteroidetes bacterium]|nr:MAG: FAD-binding oxidoreductase [Bacteroidota bacterium]